MASPTKIAQARDAVDRSARTARMAEVMARFEASEGACTFGQLAAAGFTEAEIEAYRDDARAILSGRPLDVPPVPGRAEGLALVTEARAIRARSRPWTVPVVQLKTEAVA